MLETQKILDTKRSKVEYLKLQIKNINSDRNILETDVNMLLAQQNIYCNSTERLYAKLTALHHSSDISKEQHRKLLPFLTFEREKIDSISYDYEKTIAEFDRVPDNRFAYGIVKIDEYMNADELVEIVNDTLTM